MNNDTFSEDNWLFPEGYTGLRFGIGEHINDRRFVGYDFGIYCYLHIRARWATGICYTNAVAIAGELTIPLTSVQESLQRMRERKYINYSKGDGSRGLYTVLIHKARPTVGVLYGYELDAFTDNTFQTVTYYRPNTAPTVAVWKPGADRAETVLMKCGDRALTVRTQDIQDGKHGKDQQDSKTATQQRTGAAEAAFPVPASGPEQVQRVCDFCHNPESGCKGHAACTWPKSENKNPLPAKQGTPPPIAPTPSSEEKVAGYNMSTIREHVQRLIESGDFWVETNATEDALHRKGFVEHVMTLEPKKKSKQAAASSKEPQRGSYEIETTGEIA